MNINNSSSNVSSSYGGYGGVSKTARYVPPPIPEFVPQPATAPFYIQQQSEILRLLNSFELSSQMSFVQENSAKILLRFQTQDIINKSFVMYTSGNPDDKITYTVPSTGVSIDLFKLDGGLF